MVEPSATAVSDVPPAPARSRRHASRSATLVAVVAIGAALFLSSCTTGDQAAAAAASQRGVPYIYGASSPGRGFDCSGLTMWAWAVAGKHLPRSAAQQFTATRPITSRTLRAGDLAFYQSGGRISHVAMYVGHGMLVQSRHPGTVVQLTPIGWWSDHFVGYHRVD